MAAVRRAEEAHNFRREQLSAEGRCSDRVRSGFVAVELSRMTWRDDLRDRAVEIRGYVRFLHNAEGVGEAKIVLRTDDGAENSLPADVLKTMKAATYVLLYNVIEATIVGGITAIFDELAQRQVRFDDVRDEIRTVVLGWVKRNGSADQFRTIADSAALVTSFFDPEKQFSGNVDARAIRDTAARFGFDSHCRPEARGGVRLVEVKRTRNDLAHGLRSFNDVGRDTTGDELLKIAEQVIAYMEDIADNIENFIRAGHYRLRIDAL